MFLNINAKDILSSSSLQVHVDASEPMTMGHGLNWMERVWEQKDAIVGTVLLLTMAAVRSIATQTTRMMFFAIDSQGNTWAWGSNNYGQTGVTKGVGLGGSIVIPPRKVASFVGKHIKMIEGGLHHSLAVTHDGECLVWGRIDAAQMGLDIKKLPLDDPNKVLSAHGKARILLQPTSLDLLGCVYPAAGSDHNIVLTSDGKAYSWGFNTNYQCGQGHDDDISVATLIQCSAINDKKLSWAGAGGQYSMLASAWKDVD